MKELCKRKNILKKTGAELTKQWRESLVEAIVDADKHEIIAEFFSIVGTAEGLNSKSKLYTDKEWFHLPSGETAALLYRGNLIAINPKSLYPYKSDSGVCYSAYRLIEIKEKDHE